MSDLDADTRRLIEHLKSNPLVNPKKTRGRGPGKKPSRVLISIRFDPEILVRMKATGHGWQRRMNDIIKDWIESERSNKLIP